MIVSSVFTLSAQRDGRVWVNETHTDHLGNTYPFQWIALANADHAGICSARAPKIGAALAEAEFLEALGADGWKPLDHQNAAQFAARFRARFKDSSRVECAKMGKWILDRIDGGNFTDAQVRNAFGLTATQWNTLKTNKLTPQRAAYNAVLAAIGE